MKTWLIPAVAALGLLATGAQAVTFNGTTTTDTFYEPGQGGLQIRPHKLSDAGAQGFISAPVSFDLNPGDSFTTDLFRLVTFEPTLDPDDLVAKPLTTTFDFGALGTVSVAGTTAGVLGPVPGAFASFVAGSLNIGGGLKLIVSIADVLFATDGTAYVPGKEYRGTVTATFSLASIPLPATAPLVLLALGGLGLAARRRKA